MKRFWRQLFLLTAVATVAWGLMWAGPAGAQDSRVTFMNRQREIERDLEIDMDQVEPSEDFFALEWGGWFTGSYQLFHDNGTISGSTIVRGVHERHLGSYDLRLWGKADFGNFAQVYARIRTEYVDWEVGDSLTSQDHYLDGPNLDRGWVYFDLRKATEDWQEQQLGWTVNARVGRQYTEWGSGLVLSLPIDAVVVGGEFGDLRMRGLAGQSITSFDNIDRSVEPAGDIAGRLKRDFFGGEAEYRGLKRHFPFAYAMRAVDRTRTPVGAAQRYSYDSWYFGLGSRGILWRPECTYSTEFVWQDGRGYSDVTSGAGGNRLEDIEAFAFDSQVNYFPGGDHRPKFSVQYTFGSGDNGRVRPSDTINGNIKGSTDHSFNAFGFRYTGYSFAPVITNIHVLRLGFAFLPFPGHESLAQLEIGADVFGYASATEGGVSDSSAGVGSQSLGYEADTHIYWRMTSDLSLVVRYGAFFPGEAFLDGTSRHSLYTGVTLSF